MPVDPQTQKAYWAANIKLLVPLLLVWFIVAYGGGILFADTLNQYTVPGLPGYKLGFWIAQQGSIICFVILILIYAWRMSVLDQKFHVEEPEEASDAPAGGAV